MLSWKRGPNVLTALKSDVAGELAKHPTGMSRGAVFKRFGVRDPNAEAERGKVWRLVAALVGLQRDGDANSAVYDGERWYYPTRTA